MNNENLKGRYFGAIYYPEHGPIEKTIERLMTLGVVGGKYILHDKDLNSDGNLKKAHYHIVFYFDNPRSENSVRRFLKEIDIAQCEYIYALKGMDNYLTHSKAVDKALYNDTDVVTFGTPYDEYACMKSKKGVNAMLETFDFINETRPISFSQLIRLVRGTTFEDSEKATRILSYISSHNSMTREFIKDAWADSYKVDKGDLE